MHYERVAVNPERATLLPVNPLVAVHLAVVLFGSAGLFGRVLDLPPTVIVLGRVVFASLALGAVVTLRRRRAPTPPVSRLGAPQLAPLGFLLAIHWVSFFASIQLSSVAVGLLTFSTFPVFTAALEPLIPGERFDPRTLVAALVTVVGVALVIPTGDPSGDMLRGAAWGVFSGASFAVLSLVNRHRVREESALRLALHQDLWAAVFLLPFAFVAPRWPTPPEWGLLLVLGVVFTAAAHGLFIRGLKGVSAGRASVITSLEPVYGVALAWLLLNERPEARTLLGGALVLGAAVWVGRAHGADPDASTRTPGTSAPPGA